MEPASGRRAGYGTMQNMLTFMRKVRVALTPRNRLLKSKLANGAIVCGQNRPGFGGRGVYIFRGRAFQRCWLIIGSCCRRCISTASR